jgi:hypothetical protein
VVADGFDGVVAEVEEVEGMEGSGVAVEFSPVEEADGAAVG